MENSQDQNIAMIEEYFAVPEHVADKVRNIVEKVKGGYVLIETRPPWDGSDRPWSRLPVAKIVFHKPSKTWLIYWMRASGKWNLYGKQKSIGGVLKIIEEDKHGCFWG